MLDTYVLTQLDLWAAWKARRADNGLGFPKKCNFTREVSGGFWTPDMDNACINVDKAVCALLPERRDAIMKSYTVRATIEQKARMCGVTPKTYNLRLGFAFRDILGFLNDLACGIPLPSHGLESQAENNLKIVEHAA